MLRGAFTHPLPRTQALAAQGKHSHGSGGRAAGHTFQISALSLLLRWGSAAEPRAVSDSRAGRLLPGEPALAAGMGRD